MHETMKTTEKLAEIEKKLMTCVEGVTSKNMEEVDTQELGEAVDMIKDLAEAKKCCWEAKYFETVVEAMQGSEGEAYGYNPNRSSTTGRYMRGYGMGFRPMPAPWGDMRPMDGMGDSEWDNMRPFGYGPDRVYSGNMGYTVNGSTPNYANNQNGSRSEGNTNYSGYVGGEPMSRHGQAYNEYRQARRHYNETKSLEDKREMSAKATEHMMDMIATVREMWQDADPEMRQRMKKDLEGLMKELA